MRGSAGDLWAPIGFGALQQNNLRWLGTIDADQGKIVALTAIGVSQGLKAGDPIPNPEDELSGGYFITVEAGDNVNQPNVSADTFTEGDWLLCIDQAQGWVCTLTLVLAVAVVVLTCLANCLTCSWA